MYKCRVYQPGYRKKAYRRLPQKRFCVKSMFTFSVFEILLFKLGRYYDPHGAKVEFSIRKQKNVWLLLELLEK